MLVRRIQRIAPRALVTAAFVALFPPGAGAQDVASLQVNPIDPCAKSPSITVNLSAPAPTNGLTVQLSSSLPSSLTVPATVKVKENTTTAEFDVTCTPSMQAIAVTITASIAGHPGTVTAIVNVLAPVLQSITIQPHTGTTSLDAKVTLVGAAPAGGVVVTLSSNSNKAVVPASVTVPATKNSVNFQIQTKAVAQTTPASILATGLGVSKTADLAIQPPRAIAIGFNSKSAPATLLPTKTIESSTGAHVRVNLNSGGPCCNSLPVQLTSSNPTAATVPASVTVSTDSTWVEFSVNASSVSRTTTATITATSGGVTVSCVLTITPPELKNFTLTPSTVVGRQVAQGKLSYSVPAPAGGIQVHITSNTPTLAAVPAQAMVPAGAQELVFPIETNLLETRTVVTITVDAEGQKRNAQLELVPEGPSALTINPNPMIGGTSTKAIVDAANSTDAFIVHLSSTAPGIVDMPASVSFSPGDTRKDFPLNTIPVAKDTTVTVTAKTTSTTSSGGRSGTTSSFSVSRTVSLKIVAPVVSAVSFTSTGTGANMQWSFRVNLSGKAPVDGTPLTISSDNPSAAHVTAAGPYKVPAGESFATFPVTLGTVANDVEVRFTAAITGSSAQKTTSFLVRKP